jgi:nucleotide-binding universal stress UspA family protein
MYNKILVPLDGSKLAESVLDHVESIASGCGTSQVIFVSVTEPVRVNRIDPGTETGEHVGYHILGQTVLSTGQVPSTTRNTFTGQLPLDQPQWTRTIGKLYSEADNYLHRIQRRFEKKGISSMSQVLLGKPAEAIITYADDQKVDLIVMASHGRSGVSRWASGSVADRVFRGTCIPVLMVRAPGCVPGV